MADESEGNAKPTEETAADDENLENQPSMLDLTNNPEDEAEKAAEESPETDKDDAKSASKSSLSKSSVSSKSSSSKSSSSKSLSSKTSGSKSTKSKSAETVNKGDDKKQTVEDVVCEARKKRQNKARGKCICSSDSSSSSSVSDDRRDSCVSRELNTKQCVCGPPRSIDLKASKAKKASSKEQPGLDACTCGPRTSSLSQSKAQKARQNEQVKRKSNASSPPCICNAKRGSVVTSSSSATSSISSTSKDSCVCGKSSSSSSSSCSSSSSSSRSRSATGSTCQCCHCVYCRKMENSKQSAAKAKNDQLRYFLQKLLFDMQSFENAFASRQMELENSLRRTLAPKVNPIKIVDISELGPCSLLINWQIPDPDAIAAIHVYIDGHMVNQFFSPYRCSAAIHDVDVDRMHQICVVAQQKNNTGNLIDEICRQILGRNQCMPPKSQPPMENWQPSRFTYIPDTQSFA